MAEIPSISDAEWEVMNVLWAQSPLTGAEIVERLAGRREWNPRTIKTLINRLVKKRAVEFSTQANRYLYRPRVKKQACVRQESRSFSRRVFAGSTGPMLVQFIRQANLTKQEIEELQRILSDKSR